MKFMDKGKGRKFHHVILEISFIYASKGLHFWQLSTVLGSEDKRLSIPFSMEYSKKEEKEKSTNFSINN